MQHISQPMALTGTRNTRELGGYRTKSGLLIKPHSLLRSDALDRLTAEDARLLSDYGVGCIIDLRFPEDVRRQPDRLELFDRPAEYAAISLQEPVRKKRYAGEFPPSMWELYCWMLDDSQEQFRQVFETIARFPGRCILFHCSGGKDRTGMVAMLLLKLAGVDDETVIGDYALTETVMKELFVLQTGELESRGLVVPPHIMRSPPENMEKALRYLAGHYGTAAEYLSHIGVKEDSVRKIRDKMLSAGENSIRAAF